MTSPSRLRSTALGIDLVLAGNFVAQAAWLTWLFSQGAWDWALWVGGFAAALLGVGGLACCFWAPFVSVQVFAGLTLALSLAVGAVELWRPEITESAGTPWILARALPAIGLALMLVGVQRGCRQLRPQEGQGVQACLSLAFFTMVIGGAALTNGWHTHLGAAGGWVLAAIAVTGVLSGLQAMSVAARMLRRVAASLEQPAPVAPAPSPAPAAPPIPAERPLPLTGSAVQQRIGGAALSLVALAVLALQWRIALKGNPQPFPGAILSVVFVVGLGLAFRPLIAEAEGPEAPPRLPPRVTRTWLIVAVVAVAAGAAQWLALSQLPGR